METPAPHTFGSRWGGWQLPAAPGQGVFGFVLVQPHMAGDSCCLLLSAKCSVLCMGSQAWAHELSGF